LLRNSIIDMVLYQIYLRHHPLAYQSLKEILKLAINYN